MKNFYIKSSSVLVQVCRCLLPLCAALFFTIIATAQPGSIDASFNPTDLGFGSGQGANNQILTTAIQSDGKIIMGGSFSTYNSAARNYIARLNSNGSLDASFNMGTGANSPVLTIAIQPDGKIIIGGSFLNYNGTNRNRIARLNSDGSLDVGFDPGTGADGAIYSVAIQADGKIIIGGYFSSYNGTAINSIARLNTDGSLDASFDSGTGPNSQVQSIAIQNDGKIIIGGFFTTYDGMARNFIARVNIDGSLDASFNPGTGADNYIWSAVIQSDGKIMIGGYFTLFNGTAINKIARLNNDGSLDASFNPGTDLNSQIQTIAIQNDGKIIIGGNFITYDGTAINSIARLNSNGSRDASFNPALGTNSTVWTAAIQLDGKILIGGDFNVFNGMPTTYIARLNNEGSLDTNFNPATGANDIVWTAAIQLDGKIIIGGSFTNCNGSAVNRIARLNSNGSLDASFTSGTGVNNYVFTTAIQSDGKIIIGGYFDTYNGISRNSIARLNSDGSLDASFNPGTGTNTNVWTIAIQSDGKIIIGGDFTQFNGVARNGIVRLNSDGSVDASFNPGTGTNNTILYTALQSDGKIIIAGGFTMYNGLIRNSIARLNSDGSLDASFNPGLGTDGFIQTAAIQPDGKIIIGGYFTTFNGTVRNCITRLNSNGSLDASFNPGTGASFIVQTSAIQSDGKIIIGGQFTTYNGTVRNYIARVNSDGSLDASFNPGTGANSQIRTTAIQSDGSIIIGGEFTGYNGTGRNRVARVIGGNTIVPITLLYFRGSNKVSYNNLQWSTTAEKNSDRFELERSTNSSNFSKIATLAAQGNSNNNKLYHYDDDLLANFAPFYFYRLKMVDIDGKTTYSPIIKITSSDKSLLQVFPNPAKDIITLSGLQNKGTIKIIAADGKLVRQITVTANSMLLDISTVAKGVYILQYNNEEKTKQIKIIKQ